MSATLTLTRQKAAKPSRTVELDDDDGFAVPQRYPQVSTQCLQSRTNDHAKRLAGQIITAPPSFSSSQQSESMQALRPKKVRAKRQTKPKLSSCQEPEKTLLFVRTEQQESAVAASGQPVASANPPKISSSSGRSNEGISKYVKVESYKAEEFALPLGKLPSIFIRKVSNSHIDGAEISSELPVKNICDGVSVFAPDDSDDVATAATKFFKQKLKKIKEELPTRRSPRAAATKQATAEPVVKQPKKSSKNSATSQSLSITSFSVSQQQHDNSNDQPAKGSTHKMKMMPIQGEEPLPNPEKYLKLGHVVWAPARGEFPPWPAVITRIDVPRAKKSQRKKKHSQSKSTAESSQSDADAAVVVPSIKSKTFHYIYLEPDFDKFIKRKKFKSPYTSFRQYRPTAYRSRDATLYIYQQLEYFSNQKDNVLYRNFRLLYNTTIQMADFYNEKRFLLPGMTSSVSKTTATSSQAGPILDHILSALEAVSWIGYVVFCQDDFARQAIEEPTEKALDGFKLLSIQSGEIGLHFKKDVDKMLWGDTLPCVDKPTYVRKSAVEAEAARASREDAESVVEDEEREVKEEDFPDNASDVTVAEFRDHRFCVAPWVLPVELADPEDVLQYENDEEITDKHNDFVRQVLQMLELPELEAYLHEHLDVEDVKDPKMYWRMRVFLQEGQRSEKLVKEAFFPPINDEEQKFEYEEAIDDWFISELRGDCRVKCVTTCTSDVRRKMIVDMVVQPLIWVFAVSRIRECSMKEAERLLSTMLD